MQIKSPFRFLNRKSGLERPVKLTEGSEAFYTFMPNWDNHQETQTMSGQAWAYNHCPPVNAIINKKVRAFSNGRWKIVNENGDEVPPAGQGPLSELMARPNPMQTWNEFVSQAKTYEQVFGEVYILPVTPLGMSKEYTKSAWVIPNWIITEIITGNIYSQTKQEEIITGYAINMAGKSRFISPDNMLRIRDVSIPVSEDPTKILHGQSRLYSLSHPVSNIIAAYEARNVMITRKGALGILSNDGRDVGGTIPLKPKEKKDLQEDFQSYGLSKQQFQVIITNASMKWQPMSFPTKDLMLFEEIVDDTRQIADCYDYPMYLLGFKEGSTFSNVMEAKKSLYQDAIIPEAEAFADAIGTFFQLPKGLKLRITYDHLEIFQRSRKDIADALRLLNQGMVVAFQNKIITREEWRSAMELNPTEFLGDTFYEGPSVEVQPATDVSAGDVAHSEQPKPRS